MITLRIDGMSCTHCVLGIRRALAAVPGVEGKVDVSLERGQAVVHGKPAVADLVTAVADEGYVATLLGQDGP